MSDYQIQAPTRRCAATGRALTPGEKCFSVLFTEGAGFRRADYAREAWRGPPAGVFSFWLGRVPPATESRKARIDDELLFDCFQRLAGESEPSRLNFRYVVALLLMRRKRLRFEEARTEAGREILVLHCTRSRTKHEVVNPRLSEEEMAAVQDEVFKVLGWD